MKRSFFTVLTILSILSTPATALAQASQPNCPGGYRLGVPLGELREVPRGSDAFRCYVIGLYKYLVGLSIVLAAIVSTWAGYIWLTSGGDPAKITHSRELIIGALSGLALLLLASTVLRWIVG